MAEVKFLCVPEFSPSTRRYAIGSLDKISNVVHTASDVKVSEDFETSIKIESFANYNKVNMVKIGSRYYDVINVRELTRQNGLIEFSLVINAISTLLTPYSSLYGMFDRVPERLNPSKRLNMSGGTLAPSRVIGYSNLDVGDLGKDPIYYVQITTTKNLTSGSNSELTVYGCYCRSNPNSPMGFNRDILYSESNTPGTYISYPYLETVINDIDAKLNIPSSTIIDVSISRRSPWSVNFIAPAILTFYGYDLQGNRKRIIPNHTDGGELGLYDGVVQVSHNRTETSPESTITLELSNLEAYCGVINIVDEHNNVVGVIPNEYLSADNKLDVSFRTYADYTGIYTSVVYRDIVVNIPEGRLPWVGDTWKDYAFSSLEHDRTALQNAVMTAKEQLEIDLMTGASNALLTSGVGAMSNPIGAVAGPAQFAIGAYASGRERDLTVKNLRFEQDLVEARQKSAPSTNYQTAYGINYISNHKYGGLGIRIDTPRWLSEDQFNAHVAMFGWPCGNITTITPKDGYIKGEIYNMNEYGPLGDRLKEEIAGGVRIKVIA